MDGFSNEFFSIPFMEPDADNLTYQIYRAIKEDILFGRLEIGERLNIVKLAEQYKVSRTPVKKALERLKRDNLIAADAGKQARVTPPSVQEITNVYFFRKQLEPVVAQYSLKYIPQKELIELKERLKELELIPEQHISQIEFDRRLHAMFWRYLNSPMAHALFQIITDYSVRIQSFTIHAVSRQSTNNAEHMEIINAALEQDRERMKKAVHLHLTRSLKRLLDYYKEEYISR